ncbi:MAG: hypothetical protein LBH05_07220 [Deferribacteraceae bacterium]|jgi:hypothetical protein|nr:hypothetical protein [Deferribacteraceae bacterium]
MFYFAIRRAPVGDYSARELVQELHTYFGLPMSVADKLLALFIVGMLLLLVMLITYRAVRLIWKGEERKKLL